MSVKKLISKKISDERILYTKKNWFQVGTISEFKKQNDFKTFDIFTEPVILFKFKNEIGAFTNICPHRGSRLKTENRGNQVFNCIYHGWAFNAKGNIVGAPYQKKTFTDKIMLK
jgi:phenylpropionate dioxygenase-like ring-hydroxylating dioxygenase large terminal subunit